MNNASDFNEQKVCEARTSCLGCPYVDDDGYYVLCKLRNEIEEESQ